MLKRLFDFVINATVISMMVAIIFFYGYSIGVRHPTLFGSSLPRIKKQEPLVKNQELLAKKQEPLVKSQEQRSAVWTVRIYTSDSCPPCQRLKAYIESTPSWRELYTVEYVNGVDLPTPTTRVYKDGILRHEFIGYKDASTFVEEVKKAF